MVDTDNYKNMDYTVQQLANISGTTVRTLHHYDEIGLLKPARVKNNGYRLYNEPELLKLQQIMFFKELDFPLIEIKRILDNPKFDMKKALVEHRGQMEIRKKRLNSLIHTIDKTIKKINKETKMQDEELYKAFNEHETKYANETKNRWGGTTAYKQSQLKMAKMTKEEKIAIKKNADIWIKNFVENIKYGPESDQIQKLIHEHYNSLRVFYEPNIEIYRGLANMYVEDPRFTDYYEKYSKGLAQFMKKAMLFYCDKHK